VIGVRAPGRVNLIGDHTDYNDGFCLPLAIDRECRVTGEPRADGRVVLRSAQIPDTVDLAADGRDDPATVEPAWGRFVAGVVRALAERGRAPVGFEGLVTSTVPTASGLSSSSALSVALTLALAEAGELELPDRREVARAALHGEVLATGVPGGLMDQLASLFGVADHALLVDCRSLEIAPVLLPRSHAVLVAHSGVSRTLAASAYTERRKSCEETAARLGLPALRDATFDQVADDPIARHVVTENQRVLDFASALGDQNVNQLGPLLLASHASLRDDYAVSTPELDLLVELLVDNGAIGARLTGAGFGGCVVALVQRNHADNCAALTLTAYAERTGLAPQAFVVQAVDGAGPFDPEGPEDLR
jgi:galactokinase